MMLRSEHPDQTGANPEAVRSALRRRCLAAREGMPENERALAAVRLAGHLSALLRARPPGTLGFCWPIRGEFDARPLVAELLRAGWRACLPSLPAPAAAMVFHRWTPGAAMQPGRYDIPVPAEAAACVPDTLLLPLVAFDAAGYRLGYGGGYFDRTLAALVPRPLTIGVGFELARVDSTLPQAHDIPADVIVTEIGVFYSPPLAGGLPPA
ncbi:MAG: 5-formyltetrahydrofolate cyclo-ligase [Rhodocyclaceae bacterium]|nr:5-formyltetrahydrofolate cyclo-ligase [Rhodocyclaceae bacterium]